MRLVILRPSSLSLAPFSLISSWFAKWRYLCKRWTASEPANHPILTDSFFSIEEEICQLQVISSLHWYVVQMLVEHLKRFTVVFLLFQFLKIIMTAFIAFYCNFRRASDQASVLDFRNSQCLESLPMYCKKSCLPYNWLVKRGNCNTAEW